MDRPRPLDPGVWAVMPTPFDDDLDVHHGDIERLVDFYRGLGLTGVVVLGVFGEAARLSAEEQIAVVRTAAAAAGDLPVVVGLSALATAPAVEQAAALSDAAAGRARALMVMINTSDPEELVRHLDTVIRAGETGVVVQDYPLHSGVRVGIAALRAAVNGCMGAVAVKAESPPTSVQIARLAPSVPVPVFGGLGGVGLLDELAVGCAGAMTGFSHPEGLLAAVTAHRDGGFDAARAAFAPWLPLVNFEGQVGIGLALRKMILHRRGLLSSPAVRTPGAGMPVELAGLLDEHLAALTARVPVARPGNG